VQKFSTILLFDSGLGGLTVFRELTKARPDANYVYLADDARFPYGVIPEAELVPRIIDVVGGAIEAHRPDIVIVACNTAATLALKELRAHFKVPFIGTVPAIKPACAQSKSKRVSVLGTQATVSREYTRALIREFAQGCDVNLVGSAQLARYAEDELHGARVTDAALAAEIAPCFVESNEVRTDTVVLACTHYPLLLARLRALAPWPVDWIDPAPAIARRLLELLGEPAGERPAIAARMIFTSGQPASPALSSALKGFGITA
jgi:glutamate racemase